MPEKPYFSSKAIIILLPLAVLFLNFVLITFFGMETIDQNNIDNILHVLGGASISISTAGVLWHLVRRKIIYIQDKIVFLVLVIGVLCFAEISWEIFEYIVFIELRYSDNAEQYMTYSDTLADLIWGLVGGAIAVLSFLLVFSQQKYRDN